MVETEQWRVEPITDDSSMHELLATGLSAVRSDDLATAHEAEAALAARAENGDAQDRIAHKEVAASIQAAEGDAEAAIASMDEAIAIVETLRLPNGAASPIKPPYELYGEILLQLGHHDDALEKFETSLLRMSNRRRSLLGAARAAAAVGDRATRPRALRDARRLLDWRCRRSGLRRGARVHRLDERPTDVARSPSRLAVTGS